MTPDASPSDAEIRALKASIDAVDASTGHVPDDAALESCLSHGWLEREGPALRVTEAGWRVLKAADGL